MTIDRDNLFTKIEESAVWDAGVVFNRTNSIPIDKWSVFKSLAEAEAYASSNPVAYPGQRISVVQESGESIVYVINADGTLTEIGAGSNVQPDWNQTDSTQDDYIKNKPEDLLRYSEQTLTDEQKLQAKANLDVGDTVALTAQDYDELLESGKLISTRYYYIYEEVEP